MGRTRDGKQASERQHSGGGWSQETAEGWAHEKCNVQGKAKERKPRDEAYIRSSGLP